MFKRTPVDAMVTTSADPPKEMNGKGKALGGQEPGDHAEVDDGLGGDEHGDPQRQVGPEGLGAPEPDAQAHAR